MKPCELYAREPESTSNDLYILDGFYYTHIPEVEWDNIDKSNNPRIAIKYYKNHCFDGRRVWILASVWFDVQPVMIIQNAVREGDDHAKRFITNEKLYDEMVTYIKTLDNSKPSRRDVYTDTDNIDRLDQFYNYALDGHFDCR